MQNLQEMEGWELRQHLENVVRDKAMPLDLYHQTVQEILDEMNRRGRDVAKKHKKRHYDFQLRDFSQRFFEEKS